MTDLLLHKEPVATVFDLLGDHENDITYSLSWAMAQSPRFLNAFLREVLEAHEVDLTKVVIRLQQVEKKQGITDIEIESPGDFFVIVEAKRGWNVPAVQQLRMYAERHSFSRARSLTRRLVVLSECTNEYACFRLGTKKVSGVDVTPLSWKSVASLAVTAQAGASHAEKRLLRELLTYLRGLMTMQKQDSNWVYVVSLGSDTPKGWRISWIDIVKKKSQYFHRVGEGWPKDPPNYIAFRYHGRLQSIHHIEQHEIFENPHDKFPEIPNDDWGPHFLYTLGSPFKPAHEVRTGNIFRNGRVWCMLDTLFTANTISDARDESKRRDRELELTL